MAGTDLSLQSRILDGVGTHAVAAELETPPIDVGRIVGTSFRIYLLRWRPHLLAAVLSQLPALVPTLVLISRLLDATVAVLLQRTMEAVGQAAWLSAALLLMSFFSAFLFVVMSGVACQLVQSWLERDRVSLLTAYSLALRKFWRLAGAMLLAFVIVFGGLTVIGCFLALFYIGFLVVFQIDLANDPRVFWTMLVAVGIAAIVAGYILLDALIRWSVFVQAVMIEGAGPKAALDRSATLVRGNWWRTALAMLLFLVIPLLLMSALATLLNLALLPVVRGGLASAELTNGFAIAVAQVLLSPVAAIGVTILFYRLRDGRQIWALIDQRVAEERASSLS